MFSDESGFVQAWLEQEESCFRRRTNWGAIYGLAISAAVSAGCWAGIALLVERIVR